jgi:hypothetical protein
MTTLPPQHIPEMEKARPAYLHQQLQIVRGLSQLKEQLVDIRMELLWIAMAPLPCILYHASPVHLLCTHGIQLGMVFLPWQHQYAQPQLNQQNVQKMAM